MGRGHLFQGFIDWWKPPEDASKGRQQVDSVETQASETGLPWSSDERSSEPSHWTTQDMVTLQAQEVSAGRAEDLLESVTEEELLDFLAADREPVEADPVFKSRLREQLWTMIQEDKLPKQ